VFSTALVKIYLRLYASLQVCQALFLISSHFYDSLHYFQEKGVSIVAELPNCVGGERLPALQAVD
jgi:hypothetical protein